MKYHILLPLMAAGLVLLCACGGGKEPAPPEIGGEPLDITSFYFSHSASVMDDCYCLKVTRSEEGTHLYAEELFSGGRIVDTVIDDSVPEQLGELSGTYHLDQWDGFDKSSSAVSDGSGFTLEITLADGSTISAHGSNRFPAYYSEVSSAIRALCTELMEQYADSEGKEDAR